MPFIVSWPGKIKPGISEAIVSQVDLFASIAALLGKPLQAGSGLDSQNMLSALLGESTHGRDYLIEEGSGKLAIRQGNWKYIPEGQNRDARRIDRNITTTIPKGGSLFYLTEDPQERNDISKQYPEKVKELRALLHKEAPEKY